MKSGFFFFAGKAKSKSFGGAHTDLDTDQNGQQMEMETR